MEKSTELYPGSLAETQTPFDELFTQDDHETMRANAQVYEQATGYFSAD